MGEVAVVTLIFAVLVGFEWRSRLGGVRVATTTLSMVVLLLAQPSYTTAARQASVASPEERITQIRGIPVSEYESGVATMTQAIDEAWEVRAGIRLVALVVLFWLACSPVLRQASGDTFEADRGGGSRLGTRSGRSIDDVEG